MNKNLIKIIISSLMLLVLRIFNLPTHFEIVGLAICYLIVAYDVIWEAIKEIFEGHIFSENFLMTVATLGAVALAISEKSYDFTEAVMVMLLFKLGEYFEDNATEKTERNILELINLRPDIAHVERNSEIFDVNPAEVSLDEFFIVNPGELVPLDGEIISGTSHLDTSSLTGESLPLTVSQGDEILSGSINLDGVIRVKATKSFSDSTASKILELVENTSDRKSKSENFISKFSKIYTPIVCALATLIALAVPSFRLILGLIPMWKTWIYRALTFLVVSCPCALVISVPLAFFAGLGIASRNGILIKGAAYLEKLTKVRTIVFDKTGTLTKGMPKGCISNIDSELVHAKSNEIKPEAIGISENLKNVGITNTMILSGDKLEATKEIARLAGIKDFKANLLPDGKVKEVERLLLEKSPNEAIAFVGDGINDAPVIKIADVGISMGGIGSDSAVEASDIVLMDDNPEKLIKALKIAKKVLRIVKENIVLSIGIKIICLALVSLGLTGMWLAVFSDVGVMIIAVLNSLRIMK